MPVLVQPSTTRVFVLNSKPSAVAPQYFLGVSLGNQREKYRNGPIFNYLTWSGPSQLARVPGNKAQLFVFPHVFFFTFLIFFPQTHTA